MTRAILKPIILALLVLTSCASRQPDPLAHLPQREAGIVIEGQDDRPPADAVPEPARNRAARAAISVALGLISNAAMAAILKRK